MPPRGTTTEAGVVTQRRGDRFNRRADAVAALEEPCVVTIHGQALDLTQWARAHPGGVRVLQKFHQRDATRAFMAVGHSDEARALLETFVVVDTTVRTAQGPGTLIAQRNHSDDSTTKADTRWKQAQLKQLLRRWKMKLFTHEDRYGIHKVLGVFCLGNYIYRFALMLFGDPTAGMGSHSTSLWPVLSLVPHALLSLSSLLFATVPRERVVARPMIWQEFRAHNIIFGLRSLICSAMA